MPGLSYTKAKEQQLLNEKEVERFAILFLAGAEDFKPSAQAWKVAAAQAGNTANSFRVLFNGTMAKLRKNECFLEEDGEANLPTPASTPKAKQGGKRKAESEGVDGGSPRKKTTRTKKSGHARSVKEEPADQTEAHEAMEEDTSN